VVSSFVPPDQELDAFVGDTLLFEVVAIDPDNTTLKQRFTLNDSLVSDHRRWNYVVADTGLALVECVVTDGAYNSRIQWQVTQYIAINYPPEIIAYSPIESNPVVIIGDEIEFGILATDPENEPLDYRMLLDDSLVTRTSEYLFQATEAGEFNVEAIVSDGEHAAIRLWHLTVTPVPDTIPPAEVTITLLEKGDNPGEVRLEWTAVGADGMDGVASNYLVRTSPAPIVDEATWMRASERPGVPAPLAPGERMTMVVDGLTPAHFTHVAVRAVDAFGNLSPLGPAPGIHARGMQISGNVKDAMTGAPMSDVQVKIVSYRTTTDANGDFVLYELPPLSELLVFSEDGHLSLVGTHYDYRLPYEVVHLDFIPVYLIPDYDLETTHYEDFYSFYIYMTEIGGSPYPNHQRRWEAPIDVYSLPYEKNGLDYQATVHQAALGLNPHIGLDIFNVVNEVPAVGVHCVYRDDIVFDNYGVLEWSSDWYPVVADIEFRTVYSPASAWQFERVVRHELGHALGIHNHSLDQGHLMVGGITPQVDTFTPDELALIRVLYHVPRGTPMSRYIRN
jgi:hypothetical protein